jgi:predicted tellurium resistance membrane protein TerC
MADIFTLDSLVSFGTLTALETVLGIDNIIFIAIVAGRLPKEMRDKARLVGLALAVVTRVALLYTLTLFMGLTSPLFEVAGQGFSGKDLILLGGGLFLMVKATHEIHTKFEETEQMHRTVRPTANFAGVVAQILLIDIIFSLDSVITAVGMVQHLSVMIAAIITSIVIMLLFSKAIVEFVDHHPTVKMLALSFLILIGVLLVAEGFGKHLDKKYVYFAMAFSLGVEMLNIRLTARKKAALEIDRAAGRAVELSADDVAVG